MKNKYFNFVVLFWLVFQSANLKAAEESSGIASWFRNTFFSAPTTGIQLNAEHVRDSLKQSRKRMAEDLSGFFWRTKAAESPVAQGKKLYNSTCMQCHGPIEQAKIREKTVDDINSALDEEKKMAKLKGKFTASELDLIAQALSAPLSGETANSKKTPADQKYAASNPKIYSIGRKYFPADETAAASRRIFRLTRIQLDATIISLLPKYFTASISKMMAKDPLQTNYEYADILNFNSSNFWQLSNWLAEIADRVRKDPSGVVDCKASNNSADCVADRARKFMVRAFRGKISEEKMQKFLRFYNDQIGSAGFADATGDLVEAVLNSPDFLFRTELGTGTGDSRLTSAETLGGISYTLSDFPPESLGLSSANPESYVKSPEALKGTVDSILSSSAARRKLARFFISWLEIRDPDDIKMASSAYPDFNLNLAQAMVEESQKFLQFNLAKPAPKLKDLTQATQSFVSQKLDAIYGTSASDPNGNNLVSLDTSQRLGIFSQPAVIASHSGPTSTRLVKRGVFWVRKVMCMDLEQPPAGLNTHIPPSETTTERQRIETGTNQTACLGCHKIINPFGFFQENMDALGKWRTQDNAFPIDTNIKVDFLDEGSLSSSNYVDTLKAFTNSDRFKQCFVRQLFRYYMGRVEEESDHPVLREMYYKFAENNDQDILSLLKTMVGSNRFVQRGD